MFIECVIQLYSVTGVHDTTAGPLQAGAKLEWLSEVGQVFDSVSLIGQHRLIILLLGSQDAQDGLG